MMYRIVHRTRYHYAEPVTVSHHASRVEPRETGAQRCARFDLEIFPKPSVRKMRTDYFGNRVCFFSIQEIHQQMEVCGTSLVSVGPVTPCNPRLSPSWGRVAALFRDFIA